MFNIEELIESGIKDGKDIKTLLLMLASGIDENKNKVDLFESLYHEVYNNRLCDKFCIKLVEEMRNRNNESGIRWTIEETNELARKIGVTFSNSIDDYTQYEFWAAVHMIYYDYGEVIKESGVTDVSLFGKMADAYLDDIDAPKDKLVHYFFLFEKHKEF